MITVSSGIYQSSLLGALPGITHGFSTRMFGDARAADNEQRVISELASNRWHVVGVKQVHGSSMVIVDEKTPRVAADADGLVTNAANTLLEVHVADCVPILLADSKARIIAAVHAGWKGIIAHIVENAVSEMVRMGAKPEHIIAAIGPHIGMCCYTVSEERARLFQKEFGQLPQCTSFWKNEWHLDIGVSVRRQLADCAIPVSQIDYHIGCTACQTDRLFSYRKDTKETFGEIIGVIGKTI